MIQVEKIISESLNENEEHLARIKRQMALLQANPTNRALLSSLIRTIYLIQGSCRFLGLVNVDSISQQVKVLLSRVRAGEQSVTPELVLFVLRATAAMQDELSSALLQTGLTVQHQSCGAVSKDGISLELLHAL